MLLLKFTAAGKISKLFVWNCWKTINCVMLNVWGLCCNYNCNCNCYCILFFIYAFKVISFVKHIFKNHSMGVVGVVFLIVLDDLVIQQTNLESPCLKSISGSSDKLWNVKIRPAFWVFLGANLLNLFWILLE